MAETSNTPINDAYARGSSKRAGTSSARPGRNRTEGGRGPQPAQQGLGLWFVLNALRQWWKLSVPVGLLLAAAAGITVHLTFEPQYRASAWLKISSSPHHVVYPGYSGSSRFVENQTQLMRSPLVLGPVIADPEVAKAKEVSEAPDPIRYLQSRIGVRSVGGSEFYEVSFVGYDPELTSEVVTAVIEAYFQLQGQQEAEGTQRVIALLEEEHDRRLLDVQRLREQVRQLTIDATGKDPFAAGTETPGRGANHPLAQLESRLTQTVVDAEVLRAQISAFEQLAKQRAIVVTDEMVEQVISQDAEIQSKIAEFDARKAHLDELANRLAKKKNDPIYRQALEAAADALAREPSGAKNEQTYQWALAALAREEGEFDLGRLREEVRAGLKEAMAQERQQQLKNMKTQLESYEVMATTFREQLGIKEEEAKELAGQTLDLEFKRAEYERAQKVLGMIGERIEKLRTEQRAPGRVALVQAAETPRAPLEVVPWKKIVVFSLLAFCAPLGLAVGWERLVRRVSDAEQIEQAVNVSVVGEVARLPVRASTLRRGWGGAGEGVHVYEESIDSLRTSLILSEPLKDMQVLAITSATNGEGKTSVAVQLAVSIARASSKPTLLIDGDMRAPDIHRLLGTDLEPGLSEVLAGDVPLDEAIRTEWSDYVHLLPAGKALASPHKLLGNGSLKSLLDRIRDSYRYVVIDTPPVLAASEALVLAKNADATLVCAMRDSSRVDQIRRTYDRLLGAEANPVGVVLNGIPARHYAYRYGAYGYRHAVAADSIVADGNGYEASAAEAGNGYESPGDENGGGHATLVAEEDDAYETLQAEQEGGYEGPTAPEETGYEVSPAPAGDEIPYEDGILFEDPARPEEDPDDDEIR